MKLLNQIGLYILASIRRDVKATIEASRITMLQWGGLVFLLLFLEVLVLVAIRVMGQ